MWLSANHFISNKLSSARHRIVICVVVQLTVFNNMEMSFINMLSMIIRGFISIGLLNV